MHLKTLLLTFASILIFACVAFPQTPEAKPTPPDDPINIFTEEVHLNVTAQTVGGRFVTNLKPDDLLIVEEGTPQKIESMKQIPANVLLLLDTGGNLNFAKSLGAVRLTAKLLVQNIPDGNRLAVVQSYTKIETVADWTDDKAAVQSALDQKLFGGNRSRFAAAINSAIEMFKSRPLENRHLVFIGDGLDSIADKSERDRALKNLLAANITIHVIAFNQMEANRAKGASRDFQIGEEKETPRIPEHILEQMLETMPPLLRDQFRMFMKAERLFVVRLDRQAVKLVRSKREQWSASQIELKNLAEDSGGMFHSPEEMETMWKFAVDIGKAVGSQYVVTYIPTKLFSESAKGEERKIQVSTHCDGVRIRSRQKIVVP